MNYRVCFLALALSGNFVLAGPSEARTGPVLAAAPLPAGVPAEDPILAKLRPILKNQGDFVQRQVKRIGNLTLSMESFISTEGDLEYARRIFSDPATYPKWALTNINVKTSGGSYFVKIVDLVPDPKDPQQLTGIFFADLPVVKVEMKKVFRVFSENDKGSITVHLESASDDKSELGRTHGELKIYPAEGEPGRLWMYANTSVVLKHWLLYEALPEKLLNRESGERLQTIVDNYQREESRLRSVVPPAPPTTEAKK